MTTKTKLTDTLVRNAKPGDKPRKLVDGNAMYLLVSTAGSKTWKYDFRLAGKQCSHTLGTYPAMSLGRARAERDRAAELVRAGEHPREYEERQQQARLAAEQAKQDNTLSAYCSRWFKLASRSWSETYSKATLGYVTRYVDGGPLGTLPVADITVKQVRALLEQIAYREGMTQAELKKNKLRRPDGAPHVAIRVRRCLVEAFAMALEDEACTSNPAASLRPSKVIKKPKVRHNVKLKPNELARLVRSIAGDGAMEQTKIGLRLLLLTFVRNSELRCATWKEFDLDNAVWTIPASRMKMREPHVVPLATQAVTLLRRLRVICDPTPSGWLFPNQRRAQAKESRKAELPDNPMTSNTFNRVLERLGLNGPGTPGFSSHGCRGTAYTLLSDAGFNDKAIDRQLAHKEPNAVKAAYDASEFMAERVRMMQWWANYLDDLETAPAVQLVAA